MMDVSPRTSLVPQTAITLRSSSLLTISRMRSPFAWFRCLIASSVPDIVALTMLDCLAMVAALEPDPLMSW
uniref:Uncharacterized protein n=1 Tax=Arundo donax TaxID=35708 RepID=A0A0A9A311_ARUDO